MEPIREDARHGDDLDQGWRAGDSVFNWWPEEKRAVYMSVDGELRRACYQAWLAYYEAHPEERPDPNDDVPF